VLAGVAAPAGPARTHGPSGLDAHAGPPGARTRTPDPVAAMARLGDREREVAVLRLLLGHSLAHTARQLDQGTLRQVDAHARQGECGPGRRLATAAAGRRLTRPEVSAC
jgi:hypothetical protein